MNLRKNRNYQALSILPALLLLLLSSTPAYAATNGSSNAAPPLNAVSPHSVVVTLDQSFSPSTGGVPFCSSGSLGTILCYPPNMLKVAYHFPSATQGEDHHALDGSGQTVVIVDAFGSPTIQSDLNTFDAAFGLPAATVTILCGPTWTGSPSDNCPVKTIGDLSTAPNAALCGAVGWAEETTLDVTQVHGLAPGAKVVLVVSNDCFDTNINSAEQAVVSQNKYRGSIMSQSFGEPDDLVGCLNFPCTQVDPTIKATADKIYRMAQERDWTVIASSGDDGANTALRAVGTTEMTPSWPSTNPLNLAAGGTQGQPYGGQYGGPPRLYSPPHPLFSCPASKTCNTGLVLISGGTTGCGTAARPGVPTGCTPVGYGGEGTWNEFNFFGIGTSSGGGVSTLYERPDYQSNLGETFHTLLGSSVHAEGRLTPDVSFNAAIHGGVLAYLGFLGRWAVFGGTSAASPAWAAIIALVDQKNGGPVGFINPAIYALGQSQHHGESSNGVGASEENGGSQVAFHDITGGNNSDTAGQVYPFCPSPTAPFVSCQTDGFLAGKGYDLTTGWGTPDVANFITAVLQQESSSHD